MYKRLAEWYLRAWYTRGLTVTMVADSMRVNKAVVTRLVNALKMVHSGIAPGYFPNLSLLERFGKALGYDLHISLEETQ